MRIGFPDIECEIDGLGIEFYVVIADEDSAGINRFPRVKSGVQACARLTKDVDGGANGGI